MSILETIAVLEEKTGRPFVYTLDDENRIGDHICYISDLSKIKRDYPEWDIRISVEQIIDEMLEAEMAKLEIG